MKMRKTVLAIAMATMALTIMAANPTWQPQVDQCIAQGEFAQADKIMKSLPKKQRKAEAVRIDSLRTIMQRIRKDFNITPAQGAALIRERVPSATDDQIETWKRNKKIEYMVIDGQEWWFRKSIRNLWLLADEFQERTGQDDEASYKERLRYLREAMKSPADVNGVRDWHKVEAKFILDVDADAIPAGETLRVWMPFPYKNLRQRNIQLTGGNRPVVMSEGSKHHTVYMEAIAEKGKSTHFEYSFCYEVGERHIAQDDLLALVEPYDTTREEYKRYTASEPRHVLITDEMRALAQQIVGNETNPVLQASMVYNWISRAFPWAGAREYSTLANIPQYVLDNGHGDCGQVGLLYITLVRSLGIPARWESGWVINPGDEGWHDWAETYYEGVGWVPTDPSFGRGTMDTPLENYYTTGIDLYRMASNEAVGDVLSPPKTFIRSETVDFQPGEVEWRGGNLYYDVWHSHLSDSSITPVH